MKWITASDITNWANTKQRECADTLPELVRRLIFATAPTLNDIEFPIGDSVSGGGWDGRLDTPVVSPFFPSGQSGWEMGANKSAKTKADGDHTARLADSHGLVPKDTVFVTPRMWPTRSKWQSEKQAEGNWKDVKVIAADALELWLESAPAVSLWLAGKIAKVVSDGIRDLEDFWEEWSLSTIPPMTAPLVIAGRSSERDSVHNWITDKPAKMEVQGDSPDEAFAFLYAAIAELPDGERTKALSRSIMVGDISGMRNCIKAFQHPLVIAAPGDCISAVGQAVSKGHHVFLSTDSNFVDISRILRLGRPKLGAIQSALESSGLQTSEAEQISRDFGRSIPVLRRHISASGVVRKPAWAEPDLSQISLAVLLAGSWSEAKEGDREIMELLTGVGYDNLTKQLDSLRALEDSPIDKIGDVWTLKSPLDSWFLLSQFLTNEDLGRLGQSIKTVIGEMHPKYELPANERWLAAVHDKTREYSEFLRTGLVESLTLMAVYGDRSSGSVSTDSFGAGIVGEILADAKLWQVWASLNDVMPLLAETAPDVFLDSVQQCLVSEPSLFQELLVDEGSSLFGECKHSGLLWALESMAWDSDHFGQAVQVLSELAAIDPGGQWANRPGNSLTDIFLPRFPQTHATPEARLAAFDSMIDRNAHLAWQISKGYFDRGFISASHQYRWRYAGGERRGLEPDAMENQGTYLSGLLPRLKQVSTMHENLLDSVDYFTRLPIDMQKHLTSVLVDTNPNDFSMQDRQVLLNKIREALNWIHSYGDEVKRSVIPDLTEVLERFEPDDVLERVGWLLRTPWPSLPEGKTKDHAVDEKAVALAQEEAARDILDNAAFDEILAFAKTVEIIGVLGAVLGRTVEAGEEDQRVLDGLLTGSVKVAPGEISGYASSRIRIAGPEWAQAQILRLQNRGIDDSEVLALLLLGLPESEATWTTVATYGKDIEQAYWKRATGRSRSDRTGDAEMAVARLLDVERSDAALEIAGDPKVSLPSPLLKRLLQELLRLGDPESRHHHNSMDTYHLGYVFGQLYERSEFGLEEVAALEWPFASLFNNLKQNLSSPLAIHRLLQKDPSLFAQFISLMYKRDDRDRDADEGQVDEQVARMADNARDVIESWHLLPGLNDDGTMDEPELVKWIQAARQKCIENKHVTGVDIEIGKMLAHAPSDSDGYWPHTAVRNLIELLANPTVDSHITMGLYNKRGVTVRSPGDGGRLERELVRQYNQMSNALKIKWPRTAALLRSMAKTYEQEAKREDVDTELRDFR